MHACKHSLGGGHFQRVTPVPCQLVAFDEPGARGPHDQAAADESADADDAALGSVRDLAGALRRLVPVPDDRKRFAALGCRDQEVQVVCGCGGQAGEAAPSFSGLRIGCPVGKCSGAA